MNSADGNRWAAGTRDGQPGFCLWLTGLSGAGKSTLAEILGRELRLLGHRVELLDGDVVRQGLCRDLGFSREDRIRNIERVAFVAKLLVRNGVAVICSFISPYREMREICRREIPNFIEVYVKCPLEECIRRDPKGLYRRALAGEIKGFTGLDDPFEEPETPELVVETDRETAEESAARIEKWLSRKGLIVARAVLPASLVGLPPADGGSGER